MYKHIATVAGIGLSVLFVVVFFVGRAETRHLAEVAPRVGMNSDDLLAMAPRVASLTGVTLGTSRRVVYLLACSGLPTRNTAERPRGRQRGAGAQRPRGRGRKTERLLSRAASGEPWKQEIHGITA
jgi:hypothetical protein